MLCPFLVLALVPNPRSGADPALRLPRDTVSPVAADDEFSGPFASWADARRDYGAAGNGTADDTAPLQRALADLAAASRSPVLFLPAGTYRITRTLALTSTINVAIVGADPAATTLVWDGDAGGTMMSVNGVAYSSISRLTFDGRQRAGAAIDQSWDGTRPNFDTGNAYRDVRLVDVGYGIRGGFKDRGFAETSIVRARFVRNRIAGVALGNFNALDIWIWASLFEDCEVGVTNAGGAGNFHVYGSWFRRSRTADLAMGNTGGFSARDNDSRGSRAFFASVVAKAYPATIHLQHNTIVTTDIPVALANQGPGLLTDNTILGPAGRGGPLVRWQSAGGADVTSIGNTFGVKQAVQASGRFVSFDDHVAGTAPPAGAGPPDAPAPDGAPVVDVPKDGHGREIQQAIDRAARLGRPRPVVHVPFGVHDVDETILVPRGDVRIVGDGYRTVLRWTGRGRGPVVRVAGPSAASIRDLMIDGGGRADGVTADNADGDGGRVRLDEVQLRAGKASDLFVDGLDQTLVRARDFGHAYSPGAPAVKVTGGELLSSGRGGRARVEVLSGASSGNGISYDVSHGAQVLVRDLWYESSAAPGFASIHDRAAVVIDGGRIASTPNQAPPAIDVVNLTGSVAVIATHLDDRIRVSGDGSRALVLGLALFGELKGGGFFRNEASPPARAALVNSREKTTSLFGGNPSAPTADVNPDPALAARLLELTRQARSDLPPPPPGASDLRLFRVWIANGENNLTIR